MKKRTIIGIFVVFVCLGLATGSNLQTAIAQDDKGRVPPEVIVLGKDARLGKVTFNHGNHITKNFSIDGTAPLKCVKCHHVEQPACEVAKIPLLKTAYPSDRTVTLTEVTLKDPKTPSVTTCRSCHIRKGAEPTILNETPKIKNEKTGKAIILTNQNAFHRRCTGCHKEVVKARPAVKAPTAMKCMTCHKRS